MSAGWWWTALALLWGGALMLLAWLVLRGWQEDRSEARRAATKNKLLERWERDN